MQVLLIASISINSLHQYYTLADMSFKAYLKLDGEQYELTACMVNVHRKADVKGKPSSKTNWVISLIIDSIDDTKITEWMIDPHLQKDGEIEIFKSDENAKLKLITFKKAYCVLLKENFYSYTSFMKCFLSIIGEEISIGEAVIAVA